MRHGMGVPAKQLPRPCQVTSHQFHVDGWCWVITKEGKALVEGAQGGLSVYDLMGCYSLRFEDRA